MVIEAYRFLAIIKLSRGSDKPSDKLNSEPQDSYLESKARLIIRLIVRLRLIIDKIYILGDLVASNYFKIFST